MNIVYTNAIGQDNPHLFPGMKKVFSELGITECADGKITYLFIEIIDGITEYDEALLRIAIKDKTPIVCFDNREHGTMQGKKWTPIEWLNPVVYFVRNMNITETYPDNVYPFDWAYFEGHDFGTVTKDELFSRPYDICFTGTEAPTRTNMVNGLLQDGRLKCHFEFRDCTKRYPYNDWLDEYRQAKLYLSCDGGGMTNERPQQLFSIAAMLKNKSNHLAAKPFADWVNCIEINEQPTKEDIDKVLDIVNDKDWLYDIYLNHYCHVKNFYSPEWVANYVLKIINKI